MMSDVVLHSQLRWEGSHIFDKSNSLRDDGSWRANSNVAVVRWSPPHVAVVVVGWPQLQLALVAGILGAERPPWSLLVLLYLYLYVVCDDSCSKVLPHLALTPIFTKGKRWQHSGAMDMVISTDEYDTSMVVC